MGKCFIVIFKINRCEDFIIVIVIIKLFGFFVNWIYIFKDGEIIEIVLLVDCGDMNSMVGVFILVKVVLKKEGKKLYFKVRNISIDFVFCLFFLRF